MSTYATMAQGRHTLQLIDNKGLDLEQVKQLHLYLPALMDGITAGTVPEIEIFNGVCLGHCEVKIREHVINCDAPVFVPDGWEVLPDAEQLQNRVQGLVKWDHSRVRLHLDDGQKDGKWIKGDELRKKLINERVYTAHILDYLLKSENQHLIPEEWKKKVVFFWGTIYRGSGGDLCVRYLGWDGGRWGWYYDWLGGDWNSGYPAAVSTS